jgi:hypothetical protein
MKQLSAEVAAELPERGVQWVKEQVEAILTETESYVCLCGWIHPESPAARESCGWSLETAYLRVKTSDFDLWRCQAVSGGPGRIAVFAGPPAARASAP